MIDLRRLQVLRVLHRQGTVTSTAAALYLTPSAVSQQIRQLSRDLGIPLLRQEGRRVRLTPAAMALLAHADDLYARWEQARAEVTTLAAGDLAQLRMCAFPTALADLLIPAALRLREELPQLVVRISEADVRESFDQLLAERVDIAVLVPMTGSPPRDDPRFDQRPLLDEPQDLLVPADHRLAERGAALLVEAAREDWILSGPEGCEQYELVNVACAAAGFAPRFAHEVTDWSATAALVAHGFGVSLIPRLAAIPLHNDVVRVPLTGDPVPSRRILTAVRRGSAGQPTIARALEALHAVADAHPARVAPRI